MVNKEDLPPGFDIILIDNKPLGKIRTLQDFENNARIDLQNETKI